MLIIVHDVQTVRLLDGSVVWRFYGEVNGQSIQAVSVCSDQSDKIFIGNVDGGLIWGLETETGMLLQGIRMEGYNQVAELCW